MNEHSFIDGSGEGGLIGGAVKGDYGGVNGIDFFYQRYGRGSGEIGWEGDINSWHNKSRGDKGGIEKQVVFKKRLANT